MNADQVFERDPVPARKTLVADELGGILIQAWLDTKGLPDVPEKAWCRFMGRFEQRASQYVRRLKRELREAAKREGPIMASEQEKAIPEVASEKRKRGRPRVISPEVRHIVDLVAGDATTERGRQDAYYRQIAVCVLWRDERFAWLADEAGMKAGRANAWKPSILTELGRIPDDEVMKAVALRVCEMKPTAKEGVAMVRRFRLGRVPVGTAGGLMEAVAGCIDEYRAGHSGIGLGTVVDVLRTLADAVASGEVDCYGDIPN